jgi:hypothetical protein
VATSPNEQVIFKEYPLAWWLFGLAFLLVGLPLLKIDRELVALTLFGAVVIAFASILTVTVDKGNGKLNLRYRSLVRASNKSYLLSEIDFVNVAEDSERERMYRVELVLRSRDVVPLRSFYSIGKAGKERRARQLRSVIGVDSWYTPRRNGS